MAAVEAVLRAQKEKYKSVEVKKDIGINVDVGNLMLSDVNILDSESLKRDADSYLRSLTRDNVQLLITDVWKLPTEKSEDMVLGLLPSPITVLPREKPIPKPKPPTKWEMYADKKGIQKKKRARMMFDEKSGEWKPRWGFKRINDPKQDWLLEVPKNADPYEDQFEKKSKDRKEKVAKNEYQRLRNIARNEKGVKVQAPILPAHGKKASKEQLRQNIHRAKAATASAGVFQPTLPKEPRVKYTGKKRKFDSEAGDMESEKKRTLAVFEKIQKKKPILDATRAANKHMADNERTPAQKPQKSGPKSKTQNKKTNLGKKRGKKGSRK